jgi:hypothetical protein
MKVQIDGRYAYETDLEVVEIGDEMVLPGGLGVRESWTGIVTALEPAYDGQCRRAIGLSRRRAQVEAEREAKARVRISGWRPGETFSKPCRECKKDRDYVVEDVNRNGRPTLVRAKPCDCGEPATGAGLGSAEAFRYFMIDPAL